MRKALLSLALAWLAAGIPQGRGEESAERAAWLLALKQQARQFALVKNWHYLCRTTGVPSRQFSEKYGIPMEEAVSEFSYWSTGSKWRYEISTLEGETRTPFFQQTFDGETNQSLSALDNVLNITKRAGTLEGESFGKYSNFLFAAYSFLIPGKYLIKEPIATPGPSDLSDVNLWVSLRDASISMVRNDEAEVTFRVSSEDSEGGGYAYEVTFRKEYHYLPVALKRYKAGTLLSEVKVSEVEKAPVGKSGEFVFLPKALVIADNQTDGVPAKTIETRLLEVALDGEDEDGSLFTLDPSSAVQIYDEVNDVTIMVPR